MSFDFNQAKQGQQKNTIFPHFSIMLYSISIVLGIVLDASLNFHDYNKKEVTKTIRLLRKL